MQYELFYLVAGSRESELDTLKKSTQEIVTLEGGIFEEKEVVERRKLAYPVSHETHGFYVARRFEIEDSQKIQALTKKLNLHTGILRFVISRADELPELKTKEERIGSINAQQIVSKNKGENIASLPENKPVIDPQKTETAPAEDIDKKLEEILNI